MIFIIFDIEVIFLYPWAVMYHQLWTFGLAEMAVFAVVVFVAFAYLVSNGALDWGPRRRAGASAGRPVRGPPRPRSGGSADRRSSYEGPSRARSIADIDTERRPGRGRSRTPAPSRSPDPYRQ